MKYRSAPLDDNWNGLQHELEDDGRLRARVLRRFFTALYAGLNTALVLARSARWRRGALDRGPSR